MILFPQRSHWPINSLTFGDMTWHFSLLITEIILFCRPDKILLLSEMHRIVCIQLSQKMLHFWLEITKYEFQVNAFLMSTELNALVVEWAHPITNVWGTKALLGPRCKPRPLLLTGAVWRPGTSSCRLGWKRMSWNGWGVGEGGSSWMGHSPGNLLLWSESFSSWQLQS